MQSRIGGEEGDYKHSKTLQTLDFTSRSQSYSKIGVLNFSLLIWEFSNVWLFILWHYWIPVINVNSSDFPSGSEHYHFASFLRELSVIWFILINKFTFPPANSCPGNLPSHAFLWMKYLYLVRFPRNIELLNTFLLNHTECDAASELNLNCVASGTDFKHVRFT